jgi:membrane protein implicated in regulation of membrane protease activity
MTWADFYLVCFVVGFFLSLVMFLAGGIHLPHFHFHVPGIHGTVHGHANGLGSPFNPITFTAFLAWFGGIGYLLARHSTIWFMGALGISLLSGLGGAAIIYLFLSRVLHSDDEELNAADFEMVGVLGKLSIPIREGGTGEMIYSQAGTRRVCGARADAGVAIPRDAEVVVMRYERGIAYVRLWSEMAGDELDLDESIKPVEKEARPQ